MSIVIDNTAKEASLPFPISGSTVHRFHLVSGYSTDIHMASGTVLVMEIFHRGAIHKINCSSFQKYCCCYSELRHIQRLSSRLLYPTQLATLSNDMFPHPLQPSLSRSVSLLSSTSLFCLSLHLACTALLYLYLSYLFMVNALLVVALETAVCHTFC